MPAPIEEDIERVLAHTVPRDRISSASIEEVEDESVSPLAVLGVLALLIGLFVVLSRLG